jgi:hypothetical protein
VINKLCSHGNRGYKVMTIAHMHAWVGYSKGILVKNEDKTVEIDYLPLINISFLPI